MTEEPETPEYELVLPFVLVTSAGGPYDDGAFTVGWQCAKLDSLLQGLAQPGTLVETAHYVHPNVLPQIDLIAMRHGFQLTTAPVSDDVDGIPAAELVLARFRREPS